MAESANSELLYSHCVKVFILRVLDMYGACSFFDVSNSSVCEEGIKQEKDLLDLC